MSALGQTTFNTDVRFTPESGLGRVLIKSVGEIQAQMCRLMSAFGGKADVAPIAKCTLMTQSAHHHPVRVCYNLIAKGV
jgi:hypothetical protein